MIKTFKEKNEVIGSTQEVPFPTAPSVVVLVKVLDYKQSYGRDRWLVTPVAGKGEMWVERDFIDNSKKK